MKAMYTVFKTKTKVSIERRGHSHYSHDAERTVCGKDIPADGYWYIENNTFDGEATCPKCRKLMGQLP